MAHFAAGPSCLPASLAHDSSGKQENSSSYPGMAPQQVSKLASNKRKRVSWASEDNLNQIRLFSSEEAPAMAGSTHLHHDGQAHLAASLAQNSGRRPDLPPGFAPQVQHRNKRVRYDSRAVDAMIASVTWTTPTKVDLETEWAVVAGEESKQTAEQRERELRAFEAFYPRLSAVPDSPVEPQDPPEVLDDAKVPLIPLQPVEDEDNADQAATTASAAISTPGLSTPSTQQPEAAPRGSAHTAQPQAYRDVKPVNGVLTPQSLGSKANSGQNHQLQAQEDLPTGSSASAEIAAAAAAAVASMSKGGEVDEQLLAKTIAALTAKQQQQPQQLPSTSGHAFTLGGNPVPRVTNSVPNLPKNRGSGSSASSVQSASTQVHKSGIAQAFAGPASNALVSSQGSLNLTSHVPTGVGHFTGTSNSGTESNPATSHPIHHDARMNQSWSGVPREVSSGQNPVSGTLSHVRSVNGSSQRPFFQGASHSVARPGLQRHAAAGLDVPHDKGSADALNPNANGFDSASPGNRLPVPHPGFPGPYPRSGNDGSPFVSEQQDSGRGFLGYGTTEMRGPSGQRGPPRMGGPSNVSHAPRMHHGPMGPRGGPNSGRHSGPGRAFPPHTGPRFGAPTNPSPGSGAPVRPSGQGGAGAHPGIGGGPGQMGSDRPMMGPRGPHGFPGPTTAMGVPRPQHGGRGPWNQGDWVHGRGAGPDMQGPPIQPPPAASGGRGPLQRAPMIQWVTRVEHIPGGNP